MNKLAFLPLATAILAAAMFAPLVHAQSGAGNGSVQPGGACQNDTDCADVNGVDYVCDGTCQQAAGTQGDTCQNNNGCIDSLTCVGANGTTPGTCQAPVVNNGGSATTNAGGVVNNGSSANTIPAAGSGTNVQLLNPLGTGVTLNSLLNSILQFVVQIGAIIVVLMLVYVGFLFVTAQGNESKLSEAKKALLWTVIGALILLGAQAIALGIQATAQALSTGS